MMVHLPRAQIRQLGQPQAVSSESLPHRIIADTGASAHFTPRRDYMRKIRPLDPPLAVQGALGEVAYASEQGEGEIPLGEHVLHVDNIVLCEPLCDTLLSV